MPHSINHGDACLAYFNKIWGIPQMQQNGGYSITSSVRARIESRLHLHRKRRFQPKAQALRDAKLALLSCQWNARAQPIPTTKRFAICARCIFLTFLHYAEWCILIEAASKTGCADLPF